MNYTEFRNKTQKLPIILTRDLSRLTQDMQVLRNQLSRWQKKGLVIQLKRGLYQLNANDRKVNPSREFIANQLYEPSYISMEYALQFYGLIPEGVADLTSVTTRKTMRIKNSQGSFVYQHVNPHSFRGFRYAKDRAGFSYFIAEPEKAVVDFLYLNLGRIRVDDPDVFKGSFRFQNIEALRIKRLTKLSALFGNSKLERVTKNFCAFLKKEVKG